MTPGEALGKIPRLKRVLDVVQRLKHIEVRVLLREMASVRNAIRTCTSLLCSYCSRQMRDEYDVRSSASESVGGLVEAGAQEVVDDEAVCAHAQELYAIRFSLSGRTRIRSNR